eukprot:5266506-Amphidinium_carterae.1
MVRISTGFHRLLSGILSLSAMSLVGGGDLFNFTTAEAEAGHNVDQVRMQSCNPTTSQTLNFVTSSSILPLSLDLSLLRSFSFFDGISRSQKVCPAVLKQFRSVFEIQ